MAASADQRMDEIMGGLLRAGVLLAASVVAIGGTVYLVRHPTPVIDYAVFSGEPDEFRSVRGITRAALSLSGRGLIQFGLLILIATPIARVAFSFVAFLYQRDWKYVFVTVAVLALLLYSLLGA